MNSESRQPVQALVLDFGGVISRTLFETHDQTEQALDLPRGTLTWRGPFDPAQDPLWRDMQSDRISERDYWTARTREVGALVGETWTEMHTLVRRARGAEPQAIIRPEAVETIRAAKAAGIRLAILSNELDLFYGEDFRDRLPLLQNFEVVIDATYTKILKPAEQAYRMCMEALHLPAHACLMLDDQERNVRGALAAGMQAVQFDVTRPAASYREVLSRMGCPAPTTF